MKITDNDLKLLKYLFECKFLTRKQIKNFVLKNLSSRTINGRLPKLKNMNYIKYHKNPLPFVNEKYLYTADFFAKESLLNTENHKKFKNMCKKLNLKYLNTDNYSLYDSIKLNSIKHDYYLNNVRFMLEKAGAKGWIPENVIKENEKFSKVPDGIIDSKKRIAIEVERTLKYPIKRYFDIIVKYQDINIKRNGIKYLDYILYVIQGNHSKAISNKFKEIFRPEIKETDMYKQFRKFEGKSLLDIFYRKFFFITYEDLKKGNTIIENYYTNEKLDLKKIL